MTYYNNQIYKIEPLFHSFFYLIPLFYHILRLFMYGISGDGQNTYLPLGKGTNMVTP